MVETPILFITFTRPEYACQSFAAIRAAKPRKLYFYSNKARDEREDEVKRNQEIRSYIDKVDWDCDVKTWFRDEYVDVFTSLWGALDWVFGQEEKAIIIEEDVVASLAFFDYVEQALQSQESNPKIWLVSGNNAAPEYSPKGKTCFATRFPDIYGWGSWKSVWEQIDRKLTFWPEFRKSKEFNGYYNGFIQRTLNRAYFDQVYNRIDTYNPWDFILICNMVKNNAYALMPNVNLSIDIGVFGANRNIGKETPLSFLGTKEEHFDVGEITQNLEPTNYDQKFYLKNRVGGLIQRKLHKFNPFRRLFGKR